jgi:hypothetical protein
MLGIPQLKILNWKKFILIYFLIVDTILQSIQLQYGNERDEFEIFKFFYDVTDGYYADIGGFDPMMDSTTIYIYGRGWKGINF